MMTMHQRQVKNASTLCGARNGERTIMKERVTCRACIAARESSKCTHPWHEEGGPTRCPRCGREE